MTYLNKKRSVCAKHNTPLVAETGGPDMPTIYGRIYCPDCQRELNEVLDRNDQGANHDQTLRLGDPDQP